MNDEQEEQEYDELVDYYNSKEKDMEELQKVLIEEKLKNPSQFVSHWEADENDIEEATEEDRNKDIKKRFLWAAEVGKKEMLLEMLNIDSSLINCSDADGYTPLHRAAYEGKLEIVKFLLESEANINAETNDGWTALHSSCFWGRTDVVSLFLQWKGCDINAKTAGSQTPLHLASQNATNLKLFQLLLMHPLIDSSLSNHLGEKPVDIANRSLPFHNIFDITEHHLNIL